MAMSEDIGNGQSWMICVGSIEIKLLKKLQLLSLMQICQSMQLHIQFQKLN